jgi:hypothetical protein
MAARHAPLWRRIFALPGTRLGWWAVGLLAAHAVFMVALGILAGVLNTAGLPNLAGHPFLIATVLVVALGPAVAGITTGLFAMIGRGERSILVIAPLILVVLFLLAEVLVPN